MIATCYITVSIMNKHKKPFNAEIILEFRVENSTFDCCRVFPLVSVSHYTEMIVLFSILLKNISIGILTPLSSLLYKNSSEILRRQNYLSKNGICYWLIMVHKFSFWMNICCNFEIKSKISAIVLEKKYSMSQCLIPFTEGSPQTFTFALF